MKAIEKRGWDKLPCPASFFLIKFMPGRRTMDYFGANLFNNAHKSVELAHICWELAHK